jgi:hypothetical protein
MKRAPSYFLSFQHVPIFLPYGDKFAAAALTALLSRVPAYTAFAAHSDKQAEDVAHDKLANEVYRWADAMLKARNQPSDSPASD